MTIRSARRATPAESGAAVHPAVQQARRVVGLYGDPDVTWSIVLELDLAVAVTVAGVTARLVAITSSHPHLGPVAPSRRSRATS